MRNQQQPFLANYGSWALVTGASEGIGQAFANSLAQRGLNVFLVARNHDKLESVASQLIQQYCVECRTVAADMTSAEGVASVLESTADLDMGLLVSSAGFGTAGLFLEGDLDNELNMLQLNCAATTALAWHFGQRFSDRGRGGLILLSSIVAFQGVPRSAHYAATKAYVQSLAEGLRVEWRPHGIDVLAVAPGPVRTGFAARSQLQMNNGENPHIVAEQSLHALGKSATVRPGFLSKLLGYSLAMTPRWLRIRIMTLVMGGMTSHLPK